MMACRKCIWPASKYWASVLGEFYSSTVRVNPFVYKICPTPEKYLKNRFGRGKKLDPHWNIISGQPLILRYLPNPVPPVTCSASKEVFETPDDPGPACKLMTSFQLRTVSYRDCNNKKTQTYNIFTLPKRPHQFSKKETNPNLFPPQ